MKNLFLKLIYFVIAILLFVSGCLPTNVTSLKDPSYNNIIFRRILVIADFQKIEEMKEFESEMANEFKENGTFAVENHRVLPPIREYTYDEKVAVYKKYNLDGYILISPQGFQTATVYVPDVEKKKTTTTKDSNTISRETTTAVYPGGEMRVPTQFDAQIKFVDLMNGKVVWQSETETKLNKDSRMSEIFSSVCSNVVKQLKVDGVIKNNP
ncbi:MAG: hypothetical protein A2X61_02830 [Ignavibacteria bacterium GWB2_35_12]|nr:MAG: hypothetical protein A2X63_07290 [Ignavibacteria bacterium GWA2_35_8]OGU38232.1 MAG: hypothetical protein A2X61_02830 [Ignavibacteria bacterium GWB2_35_12]OGU95452.1 MAG: hypothetical protein A2220_07005 [Ignavibacteria bacterium RIFOXYA2_FULL_35_10]OGV20832.1 MAG: hypothetical protein A2475_11720 [Ignavibacteria bacterium RIFOXYC2_FULL_35_21]